MIEIKAQQGPQEAFLSTPADIAIYGGAYFGGKTYGLVLEALRYISNPKFKAVIFRRTFPQISVEGGLWDEAIGLYTRLGATPKEFKKEFQFPSGATIRFSHLQHEKNIHDWQGSQVPFFGFDQLEQFTKKQFEFLIFSRGRTDCGVAPYVRATCNPEPDSFLTKLLGWWVDKEGFPIAERSGVIRYFIRINNEYVWGNSKEELEENHPNLGPKSLTFIAAKYTDNKIGLESNPCYEASLNALCETDRIRYKEGNWKIRESAGNMFRRGWFKIVDSIPETEVIARVRYWDRAATEPNPANPDPDWTVGMKLVRTRDNLIYIEHVERFRGTPGAVERTILNIANSDNPSVNVGIEEDPGQAGKFESASYLKLLANFDVKINPVSKGKIIRAKPASALAEQGKIRILRGGWNEEFLTELENFPEGGHDDQVDTLSGGISILPEYQPVSFRPVFSRAAR